MVCINNEQCNTYNDNKVHNHGKTMSMEYRPGNLNKIYHKLDTKQAWECESDDFWNEIVSNFHILNKYDSTGELQYN